MLNMALSRLFKFNEVCNPPTDCLTLATVRINEAIIDGGKFLRERTLVASERPEFERLTGIPGPTQERIERIAGPVRVRRKTIKAFAKYLDISEDAMIARLLPDDGSNNVTSRGELQPIPEYTMNVPCGPWSTIGTAADMGYDDHPKICQQARFRIRICGDSMLPDFKDGDRIECQRIRWGDDSAPLNKPYIVVRNDDTCTFKILREARDGVLTLHALNKRKYKAPIIIPEDEVVLIARYVATIKSDPKWS